MLFAPSSNICAFSFSERFRKFSYSARVRRYLSFSCKSSAFSSFAESSFPEEASPSEFSPEACVEEACSSLGTSCSPAFPGSFSVLHSSAVFTSSEDAAFVHSLPCSPPSCDCLFHFSSSLCFFDTTSPSYCKGISPISCINLLKVSSTFS